VWDPINKIDLRNCRIYQFFCPPLTLNDKQEAGHKVTKVTGVPFIVLKGKLAKPKYKQNNRMLKLKRGWTELVIIFIESLFKATTGKRNIAKCIILEELNNAWTKCNTNAKVEKDKQGNTLKKAGTINNPWMKVPLKDAKEINPPIFPYLRCQIHLPLHILIALEGLAPISFWPPPPERESNPCLWNRQGLLYLGKVPRPRS